jgi:predicted Rossmann-fold nucleotide-binding protein
MPETEQTLAAAVFAGSSGGESAQIARTILNPYHTPNLREDIIFQREDANALNVLWSAADIGAMLGREGWQVITGGYDLGPMAMASRAAHVSARMAGHNVKPLVATFPEWFPNDQPLPGEEVKVKDLSERQGVYFKGARAFFFLGGGGWGTGSEIAGALKDEELKEEATAEGHVKFSPRPFFVVDPVGRTLDFLRYYCEVYDSRKLDSTNPSIIDRIYVLDRDNFMMTPRQADLLRLSNTAKQAIVSTLRHCAAEDSSELWLKPITLREYIREKQKLRTP